MNARKHFLLQQYTTHIYFDVIYWYVWITATMTQKHIPYIIVKAYLSDKNGKSVEKNVDALVVCSLLYWPKWGGGKSLGRGHKSCTNMRWHFTKK